MSNEVDHSDVDGIVASIGDGPEAIVPILKAIQDKYNYLPREALERVCETTEITPSGIHGVSTFYSHFRHEPAGRHFIKVCVGTACHVKGAERVLDAVRRYLKISDDSDTDSERMFTVTKVACLGCCTLAPAVQIDDATYGHLTPATVGNMIRDFVDLQKSSARDGGPKDMTGPGAGQAEIRIGQGSCCIAGGSQDVRHALEKAVRATHAPVRIKPVGCVGMCHRTPLVEVVEREGHSSLYAKVTPHEAERIVRRHFQPRGPMKRLRSVVSSAVTHLFTDEVWEPVTRYSIDVRDQQVCEFLGRQKHIAGEHCGDIDPSDIDEYIRHEGFVALRKVLNDNDPKSIVDAITASGLRGRGGAGFPTGRKWGMVRSAGGTGKFVVMNGDEGDPGAFMDRMLLESYPYRILEGIIIAAFAVGAHSGVLYIRLEYPLAVKHVEEAIRRMESRGFLGKNIMDSGFDLDIRIMEGGGAFVCGEETALLESIEGKRGMPRYRPPYPAQAGLYGKPTLVNNVETYACVPWIIRHGSDEFASLGSGESKGTKVFSLAGKVLRGGLIEVPMGITVREIVEEIGGGVADGRAFKAVQIGGPSGGCIPASLGDTPVDYEALIAAGAIMGSGGLVVLDDSDCMVDIARYFLSFTQMESCGKCTFCRIGTKRMLEILDSLCDGTGGVEDIEKLAKLSDNVSAGSMCALGQTAPNPVRSTLRHFRDEFEAHAQGRCPAKKCKALIRYEINDKCIGCTRCAQGCPVDAIPVTPYSKHEIDDEKCTRCDTCKQVCPTGAVVIRDRVQAFRKGLSERAAAHSGAEPAGESEESA